MPIAISDKALYTINLAVQSLLLVAAISGAYVAKKKHNFKLHCRIMRAAVTVQVISIVAVMLPAMVGYLQRGNRDTFFNIEMWIHHSLGLVVVGIWVYVNLAFEGLIKSSGVFVKPMRAAFVLWMLTWLMGLYSYVVTWVPL